MPYVLADRVLETSTTQGTGTINLAGATTGYQSFVDGVGDGNTCGYTIKDGTNWETGIGTVTAGTPDTLSRDTILASSNSDAAVDWGTGTRDVYIAPLADDVLSKRRNETITGNYSFSGSTAFSSAPKLANNVLLNGRNAAGDNDLGIIKLNASDEVELPEGFTVAASKPIDVGANKITNADNPTDPQDVATKAYVDLQAIQLQTAVATTSGTAIDFTGIPVGVKRIIIHFDQVTLSGTNDLLIQLGDSGGFETSGYVSVSSLFPASSGSESATNGFVIYSASGSANTTGPMVLNLMDTNKWQQNHTCFRSTATSVGGAGVKTLSDTLTQIRLTRNGTNTFSSGSVSISWEF